MCNVALEMIKSWYFWFKIKLVFHKKLLGMYVLNYGQYCMYIIIRCYVYTHTHTHTHTHTYIYFFFFVLLEVSRLVEIDL